VRRLLESKSIAYSHFIGRNAACMGWLLSTFSAASYIEGMQEQVIERLLFGRHDANSLRGNATQRASGVPVPLAASHVIAAPHVCSTSSDSFSLSTGCLITPTSNEISCRSPSGRWSLASSPRITSAS
jgi:hypothetical protein